MLISKRALSLLFPAFSALVMAIGCHAFVSEYPYLFGLIGIWFFAFSLLSAYRLVMSGEPFDTIAWFMLGSGMLFGLGVIAPFVASEVMLGVDSIETLWKQDIPKVSVINYSSCLTVIIFSLIFSGELRSRNETYHRRSFRSVHLLESIAKHPVSYYKVGILALLIGFLAVFLNSIDVFSKINQFFSPIVLLVSFLFGYGFRTHTNSEKIGGWIYICAGALIGVLTLYKFNAMLPLLFYFLGFVMRNGLSRRSIAVLVGAMIIYWFIVAPVVTMARSSSLYNLSGMTFQDRISSIGTTEGGQLESGGGDSFLMHFLSRLSSSQFQAYLINQYDAGNRGTSIDDWYLGLVPRFLYPEKPDITRFGREFDNAFWGRTDGTSSLALTYSAEAYWNGGFLLVILVSAIYGIQIGILRAFIYKSMRRRETIVILISPMVAFFAYAVESTFTAHKVGGFLILIAVLATARYISHKSPRTIIN